MHTMCIIIIFYESSIQDPHNIKYVCTQFVAQKNIASTYTMHVYLPPSSLTRKCSTKPKINCSDTGYIARHLL